MPEQESSMNFDNWRLHDTWNPKSHRSLITANITPPQASFLSCPPLFLFVLPLYPLAVHVPFYLSTFPPAHLPLPFCLIHGTCNLNTHTYTKWSCAVTPCPSYSWGEVSGAIGGAYPAGDKRAHNPITHPCSSLDPHYHLPWRDLLGHDDWTSSSPNLHSTNPQSPQAH